MQKQDNANIKNTANLFNYLIVSIVLVSVLSSLTLNIISSLTKIDLKVLTSSDVYVCFSYSLTSIAFLLALLLFSKTNKKPFTKLFECEKPNSKSIIATLLITFGMLFGLSNLNAIIYEFLLSIGVNASSPSLPTFSTLSFIGILLFVCILPPIFEEVIFRNILFKDFSKYGTILAILLTSFLFSIYHMSISQTAYQFIVGVLFSIIILSGGNYILTAISHFINNLFVVLNYYFFNLTFSSEVNLIIIIVALISLVAGVILLLINNKNYVNYQSKSAKRILLGSVLGVSICILFWVVGLF